MSAIVTEAIGILVSGITAYATGLGQGLKSLTTALFVETATDGTKSMADFGGIVFVFAAISLAMGLSRWFLNWVTSLGARNS